jgi:TATA-box binding protein (TBP) (component of TFIID and TFIIIB)
MALALKNQIMEELGDGEELTISEYIQNIMNNDISDEEEEIVEYPEPTALRISTLTGTCNITSDINLLVIAQYLELNKHITYINYGDIISKGVNITPKSNKKKKNKKVFYNQITIIIKQNINRYNNIKLFANGAVSMTGLQSLEEGKFSINIILEEIRELKGKVLYNISDAYYNSNIKKDIEDVKVKCSSCKEEFTHYVMKLSNDCGHFICNSCSKEHDHCKESGCNTSFIQNALKNPEAQIKDFNIVLINSDYKANFRINQKKLHPLIVNKYNIFSTFEPTIYPGVKSMYYWNTDYKDYPIKGKCYCTKKCNGKGNGTGDGNCKKVTTAVFQSGSVLITGGRSMAQIRDGYNFINSILKNEFVNIRKKKAKFIEEEPSQKIVVKDDIKRIKLKKSQIKDYPSDAIIQELLNKQLIPIC